MTDSVDNEQILIILSTVSVLISSSPLLERNFKRGLNDWKSIKPLRAKSILCEIKRCAKDYDAANNSMDVRAKQLLFKILRGKVYVVCCRFRPTSSQPFGVSWLIDTFAFTANHFSEHEWRETTKTDAEELAEIPDYCCYCFHNFSCLSATTRRTIQWTWGQNTDAVSFASLRGVLPHVISIVMLLTRK